MDTRDKLLSKVDQVNASLSNSPIVKGLVDGGLSLIPFFGQAITSALDTRAFQLFEKNSKQFAQEVQELVSGIKEGNIDLEYVESDEFVSLLTEILARNARTHEQEKIKLFAQVFVNSSTSDKSSIPYKEGFVRIIDELSIDHIRALGFISKQTALSIAKENHDFHDRVMAAQVGEALGIAPSRAQAYCDQMIRFGLLRDWWIGRLDYAPGSYAITDYGRELIDFLEEQS